MPEEHKIESFLEAFAQRCAEFGQKWDRYSNQELSLTDMTNYLGEVLAQADLAFVKFENDMTPIQLKQYQEMYTALNGMIQSLSEIETKRAYQVIENDIHQGHYFNLEAHYNQFCSTLHLIFSHLGEKQRRGEGQKIAMIQMERELSLALIHRVQELELQMNTSPFDQSSYGHLKNLIKTYVNEIEHIPATIIIRKAWNDRVLLLFRQHIKHLEQAHFLGNQQLAFQHVAACWPLLDNIAEGDMKIQLGEWIEAVRPLTVTGQLKKLYEAVLKGKTDAEVYQSVMAFKEYSKNIPDHPDLPGYKEKMLLALKEKGLL